MKQYLKLLEEASGGSVESVPSGTTSSFSSPTPESLFNTPSSESESSPSGSETPASDSSKTAASKPEPKQTGSQPPPITEKPAATPQPSIDPADLAERIVQAQTLAAQKTAQASQQKTQQPQYTQAELNKYFNRPEITADTYQALFGVQADEKQVQNLNKFVDDVAKYADTLAQARIRLFEEKLNERIAAEYGPIKQQHQQQTQEQIKNDFYTKYSDLKEFDAVVMEITKNLKTEMDAGRISFKTREQAFDEVAKRTKAILGPIQSKYQSAGGTTSSNRQNQPQKKPAQTSVGGSGGATSGKAVSATTNGPTPEMLFGRR